MKITRITDSIGRDRPFCTKEMKLPFQNSWARRRMDRDRQVVRTNPKTCNARSHFMIDGEPRCPAHAGQEALHFLLGE